MDFAQFITYGLINGSTYALVAIGLALIMGIMGIFNIAQGSLAMIAAYGSFLCFQYLGLDPFVSLVLTIPALFIIGVFLYRTMFTLMRQFSPGQKLRNSLLVSFGLVLILENVATMLWTANERTVTTGYSGSVLALGGLRIPYIGLGTIALSVLVIFGLHLFLKHTTFGKSIWAIAQDHDCAALMGIRVQRTTLIAFGLGVALSAIAGAVISLHTVSPAVGLDWTNKALILVVLAGVGSISGIFFAGIMLGIVEALSVYFVGVHYTGVAGLLIFILVLMFRPQGLFGKKVGV
jgi:branched-chain amino acid transport system permease protein